MSQGPHFILGHILDNLSDGYMTCTGQVEAWYSNPVVRDQWEQNVEQRRVFGTYRDAYNSYSLSEEVDASSFKRQLFEELEASASFPPEDNYPSVTFLEGDQITGPAINAASGGVLVLRGALVHIPYDAVFSGLLIVESSNVEIGGGAGPYLTGKMLLIAGEHAFDDVIRIAINTGEVTPQEPFELEPRDCPFSGYIPIQPFVGIEGTTYLTVSCTTPQPYVLEYLGLTALFRNNGWGLYSDGLLPAQNPLVKNVAVEEIGFLAAAESSVQTEASAGSFHGDLDVSFSIRHAVEDSPITVKLTAQMTARNFLDCDKTSVGGVTEGEYSRTSWLSVDSLDVDLVSIGVHIVAFSENIRATYRRLRLANDIFAVQCERDPLGGVYMDVAFYGMGIGEFHNGKQNFHAGFYKEPGAEWIRVQSRYPLHSDHVYMPDHDSLPKV